MKEEKITVFLITYCQANKLWHENPSKFLLYCWLTQFANLLLNNNMANADEIFPDVLFFIFAYEPLLSTCRLQKKVPTV
jgi:hypothetical protein